jgi:uncharacterized protein
MIQVRPLQQKPSFLVILGEIMLFAGITMVSMFALSIMGMVIASQIFNIPLTDLQILDFAVPDMQRINALKIVQALATIGAFIIPAFIISKIVSASPTSFMGFGRKSPAFIFLAAIALLLFFYPVLSWIISMNQQMQLPEAFSGLEEKMRASEERFEQLTRIFLVMENWKDFLVNVLVIAILPAVGEEMYFRGVLQRLFNGWSGNHHVGIWVAAAIFSFIHFQFFGFFPRLALGVLFGYLFYWTGNIWVPIFAHFLNNFFAVAYTYFTGGTDMMAYDMTEGVMFPWYVLVSSGILTAIILYAIYFWSRSKKITDPASGINYIDGNWKKVYSTPHIYKSEMILAILEANNIKGVTVNKKDSAYQFGDVEVWVQEDDEEFALKLIEEHKE